MKRSRINDILAEADAFIGAHGFVLPPFARLTPADMRARADAFGPLIASGLGWDITDYGQGDFERLGLCLFTLRNSEPGDADAGPLYAEKIMVIRHDQIAPLHSHRRKTEDIINRGGATLALQLYGDDGTGEGIDTESALVVTCDGVRKSLDAGAILELAPGESVTLRPGQWHKFWGEGGDVLVGEVSTPNDDLSDNVFLDAIGRFPRVEEDVEPARLLVSDYPRWLGSIPPDQ